MTGPKLGGPTTEAGLPGEVRTRIRTAGRVARALRRGGVFVGPPPGTIHGVPEAYEAGLLAVPPETFGLVPHPFAARIRKSGMIPIRLLVAPSQLELARRISVEARMEPDGGETAECTVEASAPLGLFVAIAQALGREPTLLFTGGATDDAAAVAALRTLEPDFGLFGIFDRAAFAGGLASAAELRTLEAVAALDALCRPGPIETGLHALFLGERFAEPLAELPVQPLPELASTHGVPVFHEQLEAVFVRALGVAPIEAPSLRWRFCEAGSDDLGLVARLAEGLHREGMTEESAAGWAVALAAYAAHTASRAHYVPWARLVLSMASVAAHSPALYAETRARWGSP